MIESFSDPERKFKLRPSHLLHLQRIALEGLSSYAGNFRPAGIEVGGSRHKPPGAHMVPEEVEHMCDYVNDMGKSSPVLFVLWKLNCIHSQTEMAGLREPFRTCCSAYVWITKPGGIADREW